MLSLAVFGIKNSGVNLAVNLIILFLVVVWLALVYWTYADARRRIADPMLVGCATAASLFPFVGTIVYMIVRPPEYLDDVRERELEMQAAEARLAELGYHLCPHCDYEVEKDFLRCPNCMRKLKDRARPAASRSTDVEDLPVLRGRDRGVPAAAPRPPAPRRRAPSRRSPSDRPRRASAAPADARPPSAAAHRTDPTAPRATSRPATLRPTKETHGAHAHPRQARRLRPQPDRRDHRPLRAQGAAAGRAAS